MKSRQTLLNAMPVRDNAKYILVWLQQALRGYDNPVIEAALSLANELELPVLVYQGVREDYPDASDRLHTFMLEAARELALSLKKRGIACVQYIERPGQNVRGLVYQLAAEAAAVFTDEHFVFVARTQAGQFAERVDVRVIAADASRLVPTHLFGNKAMTTRAFRAAHTALRAQWSERIPDQTPKMPAFKGKLPFKPDRLATASDRTLAEIVAACRIDHSLLASTDHRATRENSQERLRDLARHVGSYAKVRNNPSLAWSCSQLSPHLHFGTISVHDVIEAVASSGATNSAKWKFFDEFLTWREWSHHLAFADPALHCYASLREWPRKTLADHADDPRMVLSLDALIHGETPDEVWNAAQRYWLATGWLHNNLRMYWSKQILKWTASPQAAWAVACYINDRISLDGRDPATYASMHWAFGDAKPGFRKVPIYGLVSTKGAATILKREGMQDWIAQHSKRQVVRIKCPELPDLIQRYAG